MGDATTLVSHLENKFKKIRPAVEGLMVNWADCIKMRGVGRQAGLPLAPHPEGRLP